MNEVSCYLCGSSQALTLFTQTFDDPYLTLVDPALNRTPRRWQSCHDCGFIYLTPRLNESEQTKLYAKYGDDIFKKESPDAYFDRINSLPVAESENHPKALWLKEQLERYRATRGQANQNVTVLDVGCGAGLLMHKLKELKNDLNLFGVELNPDYAALASRRAGAEIRQEEYKSGLFGRKFDLVMCTKVLEHVRDPIAFVSEMAKDVADDGLLFIEVPDLMDVENLPAEHDRFYVPHIYFFSQNTMREVFARSGLAPFAQQSILTHRGRSYLQALAAKGGRVELARKPYDDADIILARRRKHFEN